MTALLPALFIFTMRLMDVSIGTLRVLYMVRGKRLKACTLGLMESGIFILAIRGVMKDLDNPVNMVAYALGFAAGTYIGVTLERWIASGWIIVRIISRDSTPKILDELRAQHFGVTSIHGEGREQKISILFVVTRRRRGPLALELVRKIDDKAFVTVDSITQAIGGYIPNLAQPVGVRK